MSASKLSQIKSLFDQCEPLSPLEREQVLSEAKADITIIDEVRALLEISGSSHHHQANLISKQMADMSQNMAAGQQLDVYQIDREIGRGGMGIVFLAHRCDGAFEQQVAIKISPSFASVEEQQRFQKERQILAKLQHPNIATLLGGGATDDKRPYIVMEYINGQTITQYCRKQKISLKQRLQLFSKVCSAVSYAHRHLIVHRDIKPENVLVNLEGEIKLLDFGVGKVLKSSPLEHTQDLASFSLAYASPEQINQEQTSTATDVYGLGALLYELLTNTPPHKKSNGKTESLITAICTETPIKPSAACLAKYHNGRTGISANELKGDLDNIVLKALEKEPERRYSSALEFAQDVEHFLNGAEVIATPPSLGYKLKKLFQRHPLTSGLSVALSSSVIVGLIASLNLSNSLSLEKQKLEREVATSEQVIQLLTNMFDAASPSNARGGDLNVKELLKQAEEQTNQALKGTPDANARLLNVLANVQHKVGNEKASAALRKSAFAKKQAHQLPIDSVDYSLLGQAHIMLGDFALAKEAIDNAIDMVEQPVSYESALAISQLGEYYRSQNQEKQAIELLTQARTILEEIDYAENNWSLSISRRMASAYDALGDFEKAAEILEDIIAKKKLYLGEGHPGIINDRTELAFIYNKLGKTEDYLNVAESNYKLAKKYFDINNPTLNFVLLNYLNALEHHGFFNKGLAALEENLVDELTNVRSRGLLLNAKASIYEELGLNKLALEDLESAYQILNAKWSNYLHLMFSVRFSRATLIGVLNDKQEGIDLLLELEQQSIASWGNEALAITSVWMGIADIYLHHDEPTKALPFIERVKRLYESKIPLNHPAFIQVHYALARYYELNEHWELAEKEMAKAIEIKLELDSRESIGTSLLFLSQAKYLGYLNQKEKAQQLFGKHSPTLNRLLPGNSEHHRLVKEVSALLD